MVSGGVKRFGVLVCFLVGTACTDPPPGVQLVDGDIPEPTVLLLHGAGELGTDVSARWGMDVVAPDSLELADLEALITAGPRAIVMGQGSGASLAFTLACSRPDLVGLVVMLSGVAHSEPCADGPRVSVLTIHGTLDDHTSYSTAAPTFARAKALTGCTESERYVESPQINATVEALACDNGPLRAEHWRVIGWDHNPALPSTWSTTVLEWATFNR
jgi:pimeloyl-ACP methyl ester carboxylesterase